MDLYLVHNIVDVHVNRIRRYVQLIADLFFSKSHADTPQNFGLTVRQARIQLLFFRVLLAVKKVLNEIFGNFRADEVSSVVNLIDGLDYFRRCGVLQNI